MVDCYIKFIYKTDRLHPIHKDVVSIFVYDFVFKKYKYYNISHPDLPGFYSLDEFKKEYKNYNLAVNNKKEYKYFLNDFKLYDIGILYFINTGEVLPKYIDDDYIYYDKSGYITPFIKHQDIFLEEVNDIIDLLDRFNLDNKNYIFYNDLSNALYNIERNGLYVDPNIFMIYFGGYYDENNLIYSQYNILNITGRPSNTFDKINFVAIPKTDCRKSFTSRYDNGNILMMDFSGYHPTIISKMIDYKIDINESIYENIGKHYYFKKILSDSEISYIKKTTMVLLYGDNTKNELSNLDYFKKVEQLKLKIYNDYINNGYILTPIYKRKLEYDIIGDISKSKLFSYYIQAYETELNIDKINKCIEYCKDKEIIPILYVYDSILFDIPPKINKQYIIDLKHILEEGNYKLKCYIGSNYNDLEKINI